MKNFYYIPSGTTHRDPSYVLVSEDLKSFVSLLKNTFDIVILDSAPLISIVDTEILSKIVDASILVLASGSTKMDLMIEASEILNNNNNFIGAVLNKFKDRSNGRYYYYYSNDHSDRKKKHNKLNG